MFKFVDGDVCMEIYNTVHLHTSAIWLYIQYYNNILYVYYRLWIDACLSWYKICILLFDFPIYCMVSWFHVKPAQALHMACASGNGLYKWSSSKGWRTFKDIQSTCKRFWTGKFAKCTCKLFDPIWSVSGLYHNHYQSLIYIEYLGIWSETLRTRLGCPQLLLDMPDGSTLETCLQPYCDCSCMSFSCLSSQGSRELLQIQVEKL